MLSSRHRIDIQLVTAHLELGIGWAEVSFTFQPPKL
jgi:hypothetical protein